MNDKILDTRSPAPAPAGSRRPDFEIRLAEAWPPAAWQDVSVVVAVSGGADSVGLVRGLARLKSAGAGRLSVAHFNHALRADEADADEHFTRTLAENLDLPCHVGRAATGALRQAAADGVEAAARQARYEFLQATADRAGARYVATAHTADDQAETILQRLLRGTGLNGLAGMRRVRPLGPAVTLIRPLLSIGRGEIRSYLGAIAQPWREDASNAQTDATRNWLRHELLPSVRENVNPAAATAIVRLGQLAAEAQQMIEGQAQALAERAIAPQGPGGFDCICAQLAGASRYLVREMFVAAWRAQGWPEQRMGFDHWDALAGLALADGSAAAERDFPGAIRATLTARRLTLRSSQRAQ